MYGSFVPGHAKAAKTKVVHLASYTAYLLLSH